MTSPYLCYGQQNPCYLFTEKGSQEADDHPEMTQFYNSLFKTRHWACLSAPFSGKAGTPRVYPLAAETSGSMTTPPGYPLLWR